MNIVLFNHYAGSPEYGMEYRPYHLAKYWVREGHNVTIVSSSFSHLRNKQPLMSKWGGVNDEVIDGIRYIWVRGNKYHGNGVLRFVNILMYTFLCMFIGRKIELCDLIISSSTYPLDIFPAKNLRNKFNNAMLIFEPHDLWPSVLYEIGNMKKNHPLVYLMQVAEDLSCRSADAVVSMHPQNIDHLEARGCCRDRFYHIPNGVDLETWKGDADVPIHIDEKIKSLKSRRYKIVMYTGSVSIANGLDLLVSAADMLRAKRVAFIVVGDGPDRQRIEGLAEKKGVNLFCVGRVQKNCVSSLLELADICYVGFVYSPLYRFGMSANKLWDYMMASKPILMSINASNDPVAEAKCGITVSSGKVIDIVDALEELLTMSDDELFQLGVNGKSYVLSNNSYHVLAKRFLDIVSQVSHDV